MFSHCVATWFYQQPDSHITHCEPGIYHAWQGASVCGASCSSVITWAKKAEPDSWHFFITTPVAYILLPFMHSLEWICSCITNIKSASKSSDRNWYWTSVLHLKSTCISINDQEKAQEPPCFIFTAWHNKDFCHIQQCGSAHTIGNLQA